ncbi:MAG: hypothetical protein RL014_782, partial [Pseudomonadota bacterium]
MPAPLLHTRDLGKTYTLGAQ